MKAINHLVLAGHDLEAMRAAYAALGFTVTPRGQHPFGTGNSLVQLPDAYLELLSVTRPQEVPEHRDGRFSFAAFNRDYLARHEGFSMLVLDTEDARGDVAAWRAAGLRTYEPFDFARQAKLPGGADVTVGFSLAFLTAPAAPWLGLFACQHRAPEYFAQPQYLAHANGALAVEDVWIAGDGAQDLAALMASFTGVEGAPDAAGRTTFRTRAGAVVLARAEAFEAAFGVPPPHPEDGPHLAGFTIGCRSLAPLDGLGLAPVGARRVLPPARAFGAAVGFVATRRT